MITQINTADVSRHDSTAGNKKQPYSGYTRKTMQSYVIKFDDIDKLRYIIFAREENRPYIPTERKCRKMKDKKFTILCIILIILLAAFAVYMVLRQQ